MSKLLRRLMLAAVMSAPLALAANSAQAATIVLDLNGFPNLTAGQVTGEGLETPIPIPAGKDKVELKGLKPGATYGVDFFHNSGEDGSDFTFVVNQADSGVESVTYVSPRRKVLKDFKPGDSTLKLNTFKIKFDPDNKVKAFYYVPGLCTTLDNEPGPQTFTAVPGLYNVDYLVNNAGGAEDWTFIVDEKGNVSAGPNSAEFAEFVGSQVKPRVTLVEFKIVTTLAVNYHATHKVDGEPEAGEGIIKLKMPVPVGGGGVNVWTFGQNKVIESSYMMPDGKKLEGAEAVNDFVFAPKLRWDEKVGFYYETTGGKASSVFAKANGMTDSDAQNLTVTVTATILNPKGEKKADGAKPEEKK